MHMTTTMLKPKGTMYDVCAGSAGASRAVAAKHEGSDGGADGGSGVRAARRDLHAPVGDGGGEAPVLERHGDGKIVEQDTQWRIVPRHAPRHCRTHAGGRHGYEMVGGARHARAASCSVLIRPTYMCDLALAGSGSLPLGRMSMIQRRTTSSMAE